MRPIAVNRRSRSWTESGWTATTTFRAHARASRPSIERFRPPFAWRFRAVTREAEADDDPNTGARRFGRAEPTALRGRSTIRPRTAPPTGTSGVSPRVARPDGLALDVATAIGRRLDFSLPLSRPGDRRSTKPSRTSVTPGDPGATGSDAVRSSAHEPQGFRRVPFPRSPCSFSFAGPTRVVLGGPRLGGQPRESTGALPPRSAGSGGIARPTGTPSQINEPITARRGPSFNRMLVLRSRRPPGATPAPESSTCSRRFDPHQRRAVGAVPAAPRGYAAPVGPHFQGDPVGSGALERMAPSPARWP